MSLFDLRQRDCQPEVMDQPGLDEQRHEQALRGLARINSWSNSARILWPPIRALARGAGSTPVRVLDIATGAGDLPIRLWHKARARGCRWRRPAATSIPLPWPTPVREAPRRGRRSLFRLGRAGRSLATRGGCRDLFVVPAPSR